jgi:hypothetical protein
MRDLVCARTLHSQLQLTATPCHDRHPHEDYCHVSPRAQLSSCLSGAFAPAFYELLDSNAIALSPTRCHRLLSRVLQVREIKLFGHTIDLTKLHNQEV